MRRIHEKASNLLLCKITNGELLGIRLTTLVVGLKIARLRSASLTPCW
ncbi:hypothetical protein OIU92_00100 [Escherichia coli]|nr:hypothetical protein [Escherichia coli]